MSFKYYVNIQSVNFINFYNKPYEIKQKNNFQMVNNPFMLTPLRFDVVSFSGIAHGGEILKRLSEYGVPDMYTGQKMLDPKVIERMYNAGTFRQPLNKIVKDVSYYEDTMLPTNKKFFELIKKIAKKKPDISLSQATKELYPYHKKQLLRDQQPYFEEVIRLACDLPPKLYDEFSQLMNITQKRLINDPVVVPFSEREFLYKLSRIADEIKIKNNTKETKAINTIIRVAKKIMTNEPKGQRAFGRNIKKKFENQMRPEILKRNSSNLQKIKDVLDASVLRNNESLLRLFENTSAKIHGFPSYSQFERKSFIHELKKITRKLKNRTYAQEFTDAALKLPTSKENVSAFIVKYADSKSEKIGYNMLLSGVCSVEHIVAKKNGGANRLSNFGLSAIGINSEKTNIYFDQWLKMHPEARKNCQKYVDRMIELYKEGKFQKVSKNQKSKKLDKSYIEDFAKTINEISPVDKPLILDISKLYE